MPGSEPETPLRYRQEVAAKFFDHYVRAGESCILVGMAGSGMTRLVDFLVRPDVQAHYLAGDLPLLLKVDCNRAAALTDWGLYEVMLTTLVEGCSRRPEMVGLRAELSALRSEVITTQNALLALRNLELAVNILLQQAGVRLYLVFNAFDGFLHSLPDQALAHLRALRDAHKYELDYALCLLQLPELLRPESRDQLLARFLQNVLVVGHYCEEDAKLMLEQLSTRHGTVLSQAVVQQIMRVSGRHAGLIQGVFNSLSGVEGELSDKALIERLLDHSPASIECQRIWDRLSELEQEGLKAVVRGSPLDAEAQRFLERKRLIFPQARQTAVFSPLFSQFIHRLDASGPDRLVVDSRAHLITIGKRVIPGISPLVFKLLDYLYRHVGEACRRDEIIDAVYGSQAGGVSDEALASLVRMARQAIEPDEDPYEFLLTVRGVGYRLLDTPQYKESDPE